MRPQSAHGCIKYGMKCCFFLASMTPNGTQAAKDVNRIATLMPPSTKASEDRSTDTDILLLLLLAVTRSGATRAMPTSNSMVSIELL